MDEDDLPPAKTPPHEETAAGSLGTLFGALIWIALFALVAGGVAWFVLRGTH